MSLAMMYQKRRSMVPGSTPPVEWGNEGSIAAGQGQTAAAATGYGSAATGDHWNRISKFDPTESMNKYAQGAWGKMQGQFNTNLAQLRGNAVGGGRLDTGFHDQDSGELYRSTVDDFSNNMAMQSLNATQLQMRNNEAIGQFGDTQTERGLDLGVARREELINNAREKAERQRRKKRGIAGALGAIGGGLIGSVVPGVGTMAGATLGHKIFGGGGGDEDDYERERRPVSRSRYGTSR